MEAVFSPSSELVGWLKDGKHLFDTQMNWIAHISNGHVWSAESGNWLGPLNQGAFLDTSGKVVAWKKNLPIRGTMAPLRPMRAMRPMRPMRPMKPMTPMRPVKPMAPVGGWSQMTWNAWLSQ